MPVYGKGCKPIEVADLDVSCSCVLMSEEKRQMLRFSWNEQLIDIEKKYSNQNLHSIGQTAVASIPPAIHPATMGISGFFFFTSAFVM